ncbi:GntR family transcriptional regulator [Kineosporia sp. J2-2]|uniref:GntR family transcriptional regulator n=1 Tax=Kineosporia corallincola TaxID=2835133 RepID=A0ABS5TFC4_9ACTN|nr:GntR family transcriptional regulator [Kineosporia corallincola]MBT0768793.1 GntR family transcriptional regulator [Kineosporia corallincola]
MTSSVPAAQQVYTQVRAQILNGDLRAGLLLSEVDTASRLGVSRTPVHEAFLRLEAEDFLELLPRKGAVVVPVPPAQAEDILEVRHALEVAAVRRLARSAPARQAFTHAVRDVLAEQDRCARDGDLPGFAAADESFHRTIIESSGNALSARMYGTMTDRQRRMTIGAVGGRLEWLATLADEHRSLCEQVAAGDAEAFGQALLAHLAGTHNVVLGLAPEPQPAPRK